MTIERLYQRQVDVAHPDETAQAAAQRMATRSVGSLVVVDQDGKPLGIVTDRDLALQVVGRGRGPSEVKIASIMSRSLETIDEDAALEDALGCMRRAGVRRLPVVGSGGRLLGVIALDDILAHLAREVRDIGAVIEKSSPRRLAED